MMSHKTILVVDDTADLRLMAAIHLRQAGYDVAMAANGLEALAYLHQHAAPAAIVLDVRMPEMDGWEFLRRQHQEAAIAQIPVVLFSLEYITARSAEALGVAAVLPKSANSKLFADTIGRILSH
jgi:CheY-like chemotaxis protein